MVGRVKTRVGVEEGVLRIGKTYGEEVVDVDTDFGLVWPGGG